MTKLTERVRIEATELVRVQLSPDCKRLLLTLRDQAGQSISLSLPANCANAILTAMPRQIDSGAVHPLDSWNMTRAENGQDFLLTLRTPEGLAISFTTKPWQFEAMATIATHGGACRPLARKLH